MADERKGTEYVVLRAYVGDVPIPDGDRPEGVWEVVTAGASANPLKVHAGNDVAAIKMAEKETGRKFDHGAVAVPARSWRPRVPKDEMVPRRLWQ